MSAHRTTTVMITIAHPVGDEPQVVAAWVSAAVAHKIPDAWGESDVAYLAGPQIVVTDEGSGDADVPAWDPTAESG